MMDSRHEEGQTDKVGLCQRKRNDTALTAYTQYVLGWADSEEFGGETSLAAEFWTLCSFSVSCLRQPEMRVTTV